MSGEEKSVVERYQDPLTKAFHLRAVISEEDMQRVQLHRDDRKRLDEWLGVSSTPSQWLKAFALISSRMKSKQII